MSNNIFLTTVKTAKDKIKNALFASLQAVNPFGSSGKTIVDVTISKKKRKRRSAGKVLIDFNLNGSKNQCLFYFNAKLNNRLTLTQMFDLRQDL